jgi:hypothetical protein
MIDPADPAIELTAAGLSGVLRAAPGGAFMLAKLTDPSLPLANGKHEAFAHECILRSSVLDAYERAGYVAHATNAHRLNQDQRVRARILWLRAQAAQAAQWDLEKLIAAADEARLHAHERGQLTAAVLAVQELGILTGLRVEQRKVMKTQRLEDMSTSELLAIAAMARPALPAPDASGD